MPKIVASPWDPCPSGDVAELTGKMRVAAAITVPEDIVPGNVPPRNYLDLRVSISSPDTFRACLVAFVPPKVEKLVLTDFLVI